MDPMSIGITTMIILVMFVMLSVVTSLYRKAGPHEAMVISGGGQKPTVIVGSGTVVLPMLQTVQTVPLELMSIDVKTTMPYKSAEGTDVYIDAVVEAAIRGDQVSIVAAAQHFGDRDIRDIRSIIYDAAKDNLRRMANQTKSAALLEGYDELATKTMDYLTADMAEYGVGVKALRVREVREGRSSVVALEKGPEREEMETNNHSDDLVGQVGVVTKTISASKHGEITIHVKNGTERQTLKAKSRLMGSPLEESTAVVIASIDDAVASVEPWSALHASLPQWDGQ